ncbi:uncharacterized protein LACBIDRAFT_331827 [Laccaria bicolor S238N-H82]|uniref:Predicted protein n=1 Tax=Laccaria bicolor (strain S238N-H82 / ATCC MYA-4686) TaxID=486041 RepID=B0DQP7_LACBS|nr:uncharacterized protein LACBIDRAFT_331827 [Laccaria bicolor S238N-H82]EDR03070.1 predicted protein [Laccaria bicolor S238N-H82]|eukprot:XP_001886211.1 predicted protein [Laccaria bicolor S238N-H82]
MSHPTQVFETVDYLTFHLPWGLATFTEGHSSTLPNVQNADGIWHESLLDRFLMEVASAWMAGLQLFSGRPVPPIFLRQQNSCLEVQSQDCKKTKTKLDQDFPGPKILRTAKDRNCSPVHSPLAVRKMEDQAKNGLNQSQLVFTPSNASKPKASFPTFSYSLNAKGFKCVWQRHNEQQLPRNLPLPPLRDVGCLLNNAALSTSVRAITQSQQLQHTAPRRTNVNHDNWCDLVKYDPTAQRAYGHTKGGVEYFNVIFHITIPPHYPEDWSRTG